MIQNGPIKFCECFCNLEVSSGACEVIDGRRFELCCVSADVNFAHWDLVIRFVNANYFESLDPSNIFSAMLISSQRHGRTMSCGRSFEDVDTLRPLKQAWWLKHGWSFETFSEFKILNLIWNHRPSWHLLVHGKFEIFPHQFHIHMFISTQSPPENTHVIQRVESN